jgi:C_GCAxxG_C_C family probable redox protein
MANILVNQLMNSKEEIIDKVYKLAFKYEAERGSCPQCVYSAIMEVFGFGNPDTVQAVDGLAGGTALSTKGTCGALVGGIMALSTIVGRSYKDFSKGERRRRVFFYAKKLYDKFTNEYYSPICADIHKKLFGRTFDLLNPDDYAEFDRLGAHVDKCPEVSGKVAMWTAEILLNDLKIEPK